MSDTLRMRSCQVYLQRFTLYSKIYEMSLEYLPYFILFKMDFLNNCFILVSGDIYACVTRVVSNYHNLWIFLAT